MPAAPRKSIVIIDDEKSYTSLLAELLSEYLDCRIITFARPLEALPQLAQLDPGVIVTDYFMPQLNGVEFINKAAHVVPDVSFILITGHTVGMFNRDELAKITPLKSVLLKPFSWRKLADEIVRLWPEPDVALLRAGAQPAAI